MLYDKGKREGRKNNICNIIIQKKTMIMFRIQFSSLMLHIHTHAHIHTHSGAGNFFTLRSDMQKINAAL